MTQKEIKDLTIFLGEDDAFISKYLKMVRLVDLGER